MSKKYRKFGEQTFYRPRKRVGPKPSLSIVKARIPSIERKVVEVDDSYSDKDGVLVQVKNRKKMWIVDDAQYETLSHVVAAHIALFPEFAGKLRLPSTEHNPDLDAKEGEQEE